MSTTLPQLPVGVNGKAHATSSVPVSHGTITIRGIVPEDIPLLWKWLQEYPRANFDDYGPRTEEEFHVTMARRLQNHELCMGALENGKLIGMIGYSPITDRLGSLHGICFSKEVHGTGAAAASVRRFLGMLFAGKVEKVFATYFADNLRIKKFLRKQGFVHEGMLVSHTVRVGKAIDMSLVALHKRNFGTVN